MSDEAPSAEELQAHPAVQAAFAAAWADSFVDDKVLRHEEGGYIYFNPKTGEVAIRRARSGTRKALNLHVPPMILDSFLVATYHTHPNPVAEGWDPDPSEEDRIFAKESGVPWFVISEYGISYAGPVRRVGGLTGSCGYPQ